MRTNYKINYVLWTDLLRILIDNSRLKGNGHSKKFEERTIVVFELKGAGEFISLIGRI